MMANVLLLALFSVVLAMPANIKDKKTELIAHSDNMAVQEMIVTTDALDEGDMCAADRKPPNSWGIPTCAGQVAEPGKCTTRCEKCVDPDKCYCQASCGCCWGGPTVDPCWSKPILGLSPGSVLGNTNVDLNDISSCFAYCLAKSSSCKAVIYRPTTGKCHALARTYDGNYGPSTDADVPAYVSNYECTAEPPPPSPPPPSPPPPSPPPPSPPPALAKGVWQFNFGQDPFRYRSAAPGGGRHSERVAQCGVGGRIASARDGGV